MSGQDLHGLAFHNEYLAMIIVFYTKVLIPSAVFIFL